MYYPGDTLNQPEPFPKEKVKGKMVEQIPSWLESIPDTEETPAERKKRIEAEKKSAAAAEKANTKKAAEDAANASPDAGVTFTGAADAQSAANPAPSSTVETL